MITFSRLWEEEEARLIRREEKMGAIEDRVLSIERISLKQWENTKDSTLEEPLIHTNISIRNDAIMNEEDDEDEGSRSNIPMKQI